MKVAIESENGESLAASVPKVVAAVMAAAIADGASKDEVRESIAKAIGANTFTQTTTHDPRWSFLTEVSESATSLYSEMMGRCVSDIVALLEEGSKKADRKRYMDRTK